MRPYSVARQARLDRIVRDVLAAPMWLPHDALVVLGNPSSRFAAMFSEHVRARWIADSRA
jgi:hypothetical protein